MVTVGAQKLDAGLKVRPMVLPDRFLDHASPARQYEWAGLNAPQIVATALAALLLRGHGATMPGHVTSPSLQEALSQDATFVPAAPMMRGHQG